MSYIYQSHNRLVTHLARCVTVYTRWIRPLINECLEASLTWHLTHWLPSLKCGVGVNIVIVPWKRMNTSFFQNKMSHTYWIYAFTTTKRVLVENLIVWNPDTVFLNFITVLTYSEEYQSWTILFMWPCIITNFFLIKPTRCINFSKFIFIKKLYMFWAVPLPIIRSSALYLYIRHWYCHASVMTSFKHVQDGTAVPSWTCLKTVITLAWHTPVLNVQWRTLDDGQWNCPKHVEFLDKNKFGKIIASVGFIKKKSIMKVTFK